MTISAHEHSINEHPEETSEEVLQRLTRMVRRSTAFTLAFVRCNSAAQCAEMSAALKTRLADKRFLEITLQEEIVSLLDRITERWNAASPPDLVCVYGLERSVNSRQAYSPVLGRLNHDRDLLRRACPVPLLIWLPDFALDCLVRGAPDFWAWRSGVYEFPTDSTLWRKDVGSLLPESPYYASTLSGRDRHERIAQLHELVRMAESLPQSGPREQRLLASLLTQLGDLTLIAGDTAAARRYFEDGLQIRERLYEADPTNAGFARDLSVSYALLGHLAGGTDMPEGREWLKRARNLLCKLKAEQRLPDSESARYLEWLEHNLTD